MSATITYSVPGISCEHCQRAIEGEVTKVAGVASVHVDIPGKTVTITGTAADADLRAAIDEAGYDIAG